MTETMGLFLGISTIDCIYLVDRPPGHNEKITADRQIICTGGPSSNAAITFSALGGKATLVSCLGKHPLSSIAYNELKTHGVDHIDLCPEYLSVPTVSSILVSKNNGDRSVVSVNSTHIQNQYLSFKGVSPAGYKTALFDGQHIEFATKIARDCRNAGIHTILDGGSWKPGTGDLIRHIDTAICSSKFKPPDTTSLDETLEWLHDHNILRAAITRGGKSILAAENGNRFEVSPPQLNPVRDTLAAGDIFHGAYAYYQSEDPAGRFSDHLKNSANIAAKSCAHFGPRKWVDDHKGHGKN